MGVVTVDDLVVRIAVVLVVPMAVMLLVFSALRGLRAVPFGLGSIPNRGDREGRIRWDEQAGAGGEGDGQGQRAEGSVYRMGRE